MLFAETIGWMFYSLGLDFWTAPSKITVFILLVLAPLSLAFYHFVTIKVMGRKR